MKGGRTGWRAALLRYHDGVHDLAAPASASAIDAATRRCGFALPPSFREFLLAHDGGALFLEAYGILPCAEQSPEGFGWEIGRASCRERV